eukprot:TRINITY_DN4661_c0_g1_i2.p1 TRINITY_DN4661_c0_g1~~TRINITY_DN4661_c0_g1_i2.p1  ORF type:complete len:565 (-),score=59.44 TRINITY_DN4661_c0_g1_i2:4-1698(-)
MGNWRSKSDEQGTVIDAQLNDFWTLEMPQYLTAQDILACRLVCSRWAQSFRVPSITVAFPTRFTDMLESGRVFHIASKIDLEDLDSKSAGQFEDFFKSWKNAWETSAVTALTLDNCKLSEANGKQLVELIRLNKKLQTLLIDQDCAISTYQYVSIVDALVSHGEIRELEIKLDDKTAHALASALPNHHKLTKMTWNHSGKNLPSFGSLMDSLPKLNSLRTLILGSFLLTDEHCVKLAHYLTGPCQLQSLEVSANSVSEGPFLDLVAALRTNLSLTDLALWRLECGGETTIKELAGALEENATLKSLILSTEANFAHCSAIFGALKKNKTITSLKILMDDIGENDPGVLSLELAAEALAQNTTLTSLSFDNGKLSGFSTFIQTLATKNSTLRELHVWENQVEDVGDISAFGEKNTSITSVVFKNTLTYDSVKQFIDAIARNPNSAITHLDLSDCGVGSAGCKALARLLEQPDCRIQYLSLYQCSIGISADLIFRSLETNRSLQNLVLADSYVPYSSYEILKDVLSQNSTLLEIDVGELEDDIDDLLSSIINIRPNNMGFVVSKVE